MTNEIVKEKVMSERVVLELTETQKKQQALLDENIKLTYALAEMERNNINLTNLLGSQREKIAHLEHLLTYFTTVDKQLDTVDKMVK